MKKAFWKKDWLLIVPLVLATSGFLFSQATGAWTPANTNQSDLGTDLLAFRDVYMTRNLIVEGATANDFETTLSFTDPTADRTITLPQATGTVLQALSATGTIDFASTASNVCSAASTITVTGAADGDKAFASSTNAALGGNGSFLVAWVNAADTVSIRHCNLSAAAIDPASATFRATVLKSF